jgi:hypothetical protein
VFFAVGDAMRPIVKAIEGELAKLRAVKKAEEAARETAMQVARTSPSIQEADGAVEIARVLDWVLRGDK